MNALTIGTNKDALLPFLPKRDFLLIDDGELIEEISVRSRKFDFKKDSFNPLETRSKKHARELAKLFYFSDPGGETTLTTRNGKRALAQLLYNASCLDELEGDKKDPAVLEALGVVEWALFSDTARNVLCNPPNFSLTGTILARLPRALLGEEDAYLIGNMLALLYRGTVVFTDFGFYANPGHASLIRQNRLVAGVNSLAEVPDLRHLLLTIDTKIGSHCTAEDAETLALYAGLRPTHNDFNWFIDQAIS